MKNFIKILFLLACVVIILGVIFFIIDNNRVRKEEKPIFCFNNIAYKDGGTKEYLGLGYKVIDFHLLNGYDDMKIGTWFMKYDDFKSEFKEYEIADNDELENSSFYGKIIESNRTSIIVEPNEDEEIRKSADKIAIGLGENNDAIYVIGTNVKITYDGTVMESYPAQVKATKIEFASVDEFSLVFYQKTNIRPKQKEVIISKGEVDNIDYDVYAFEGHVAINLNSNNSELTENSISLREALLQGKITVNEIIAKANKDLEEKKITGDMFKDGGTMIYNYESYTIIKYHTIDGNRDVYIGTKDLKLSDLI